MSDANPDANDLDEPEPDGECPAPPPTGGDEPQDVINGSLEKDPGIDDAAISKILGAAHAQASDVRLPDEQQHLVWIRAWDTLAHEASANESVAKTNKAQAKTNEEITKTVQELLTQLSAAAMTQRDSQSTPPDGPNPTPVTPVPSISAENSWLKDNVVEFIVAACALIAVGAGQGAGAIWLKAWVDPTIYTQISIAWDFSLLSAAITVVIMTVVFWQTKRKLLEAIVERDAAIKALSATAPLG